MVSSSKTVSSYCINRDNIHKMHQRRTWTLTTRNSDKDIDDDKDDDEDDDDDDDGDEHSTSW